MQRRADESRYGALIEGIEGITGSVPDELASRAGGGAEIYLVRSGSRRHYEKLL